MADDIQLGLKLSIKDFITAWQQAGKIAVDEVKKVNQQLAPMTVDQSRLKESEVAVQRLKEGYYLLSLGEEEAAEKAMLFIQSQQLSINQTDQLIQSMQNELRTLTLGTAEYKAVSTSLQGLIIAKQKLAFANDATSISNTQLAATTKQVNTGSTNMNMAIMQSGYILNDASMIAVNFRMALMGVANNIPMVVQGIMAAKNEASGMGKTLGQVAMQSIKGPGGILLAVNGLLLALQLLPGLFADGTEEIKEQREEIEKLTKEYEKLSAKQIGHYLTDLDNKLSEFERKHPSRTETSFSLTRIFGGQSPVFQSNVSDEKRFGDDYEEVKIIKEKISLLERELLYRGKREEADIRLEANQRKLKELNEKNFALIVEGAKSFEEAETTLQKWIKADQKILETEKEIKKNRPLLDIETDAELLKQLEFVNKKLKDINLSKREAHQWDKLRIEIEEKLYGVVGKSRDSKPYKFEGEGFTRSPEAFGSDLAGTTREELKILQEKNKLLKEQKTIWQEMREVIGDAAKAAVTAWTSSMNLIRRNQTMLEQFINALGRAIMEYLTLKAITTAINFITGLLGGGGGGAAVGVPAVPSGGIITKPVDGGYGFASQLANRNLGFAGGGGGQIIQVPYIAETIASGRNIKLVLRRQDQFDRGYRGE